MLNLPPYILLPFLAAAVFLLWVLRKFLEEERRHGARSRDSERSGTLRISVSSSSPFHEGNLDVRSGLLRPPERPVPFPGAHGEGRRAA
jgi:hypothetical protein